MNRQAEGFMAATDTRPAAGVDHPHESAHLHVAGEACYVDDLPEIAGTLYAALGLSQKAHARIRSIDLSCVRALPGVVAVLTAGQKAQWEEMKGKPFEMPEGARGGFGGPGGGAPGRRPGGNNNNE